MFLVRISLIFCFLSAILGCQSQTRNFIPTLAPVGKAQLLVTFNEDFSRNVELPGGSTRAYRSNYWSIPIPLSNIVKDLEIEYKIEHQKSWWMESLEIFCVVFTVDEKKDLKELLRELNDNPAIEHAQMMNSFVVMSRKRPLEKNIYNDPQWTMQYGQFSDELTQLHSLTQGQSVRVGVIDTLTDLNHPDLLGQVTKQYNYVVDENNLENQMENITRHGTAISGIISARANNNIGLVGLAPNARLYIYGACDSSSPEAAQCNSFNILQGIEQAIKDNVDILNLSLTGPEDALIRRALNAAFEQGIIVIAAENKSSSNTNFPASLDTVIGVDEFSSKKLDDPIEFGDWIKRSEKLSTVSGGGYQFFYGSSVSAASVSGLAALYRAKFSFADTRQFLETFVAGVCPRPSTEGFSEMSQLLKSNSDCEF